MNKKSRANFLYRIGEVDAIQVLLVWDKDLGNVTVTNDIQNVIADISEYEKINLVDHLIIYRDSLGRWDGWDAWQHEFFPITPDVLIKIAQTLNFSFLTPQTFKAMNTTSNLNPEMHEDRAILLFLRWLDLNYIKVAPDQYIRVEDESTRLDRITYYKGYECLGQYRLQQIPPLPSLPGDAEHKMMALAEQAMRRSKALFDGYLQIQALITRSPQVIAKQDITDIILDTLSKIS